MPGHSINDDVFSYLNTLLNLMLFLVGNFECFDTEKHFYLVEMCLERYIADTFDRHELHLLLAAKTWLFLTKRNDPFLKAPHVPYYI